jgi:hypothetical protein
MSWENQATKLLKEYIKPNSIFEYRDMFSQMHNEWYIKKQWGHIVKYFNNDYNKKGAFDQIKVLEIGTYTGNTLIQITKAIHHSLGVGIDKWENISLDNQKYKRGENIERVFYKNIHAAGLQNRIKGIKGSSNEILLSMMKRSEYFDLIYIDGSEKECEFYSDLLLSWQIVNKGGYVTVKIKDSTKESICFFMNIFQENVEYNEKDDIAFLYKK